MTGLDAMRYHNFAWWLARHYNGAIRDWDPEDYYQTAMVGLLDLWRTGPGAPNQDCLNAMRRAVWRAVKQANRDKQQARPAPEQAAQTLPAPDDTEQEVVDRRQVRFILDAVERLPARERELVMPLVRGTTRQKWNARTANGRKTIAKARRMLGQMLGIDGSTYYAVPDTVHRKPMTVHADPRCGFLGRAAVVEELTAVQAYYRPKCRFCCLDHKRAAGD